MTTSMTNQLITVFGGSGFLGRYVVQALLKSGARVRIAARDPRGGLYLKTQGGLGQTQFVAADIRKPDSVARALSGSDGVVNLVGILKGDFRSFHVDGARNVAEAAAAAGVKALVQVSAIGADPLSPSAYGKSKGEGEAAVSAAFPTATILRPSIVFGREDQFVNRFAGLIRMLPVVPIIKGDAKFQPVYVGDVAKAVAAALADPKAHGGRAYELGGPEVISMGGLNRWIAKSTAKRRAFIAVPDLVAGSMASAVGWMPGAPMTKDQWLMLQSDNVVAADAKGLSAFGIVPTPLESVADGWLVQYKRHGRFAQPED
jgi:uncharacterized protein YbjT (DUF2867 family)